MSVRHYPARPPETEPGETPGTAIIPPDPVSRQIASAGTSTAAAAIASVSAVSVS